MTVTKSESMTDTLFCEYIETCILRLFPNISPEWKFDEEGEIIFGSVVIKTNAGPGRLCTNFTNVEFREKTERTGYHIILSLPNDTSISAEMDDLYRLYKARCREKTQQVSSKTFYDRMTKIRENAYITDPEKIHEIKLVTLNPSDLSK